MEKQRGKKVDLPCSAELLLIHRPPMLLIDKLIERQGDDATAIATISPESMFLNEKNDILCEYFIEIIAQTMAAANGYDHLVRGTQPKDGFLVGLDKFVFHYLPDNKDTFHIKTSKTMAFGSMQIVQGEVFVGDISVAAGELKVWEQDDNEK